VCRYQQDRDDPPAHQQRSTKRMAEFLVRDCLKMEAVSCIVLKSAEHERQVRAWLDAASLPIRLLIKPACYV